MLSACQPSTPPNPAKVDNSQKTSNTDSPTSLVIEALNDGFYGEIDNHATNTSPEVSSVSTNLENPENKNSLQETNNIVLDTTFSDLDASPNIKNLPEPLFCLNQFDKGVPKTTISAEQACEKISSRLASVSMQSCVKANLQTSHCHSVNGFPILFAEFPPLKNKQVQGRILVVGGTHGDELTSVSITFKWIETLNKFHTGLFHWHLAPMMNPDGVLKRGATRTNQNRVDLNRNMPSDDWQEKAIKYWEQKADKNPRRYPGTRPTSEPETQWLVDEIRSFKPDIIISVHAPYGVVDFDSLLLNTAPKNLGKLHLNLLGTYPGSLGNYAGINRNIPVITLELPHAWEMPSEKETTKIWEDIVSWLRQNVHADTPIN